MQKENPEDEMSLCQITAIMKNTTKSVLIPCKNTSDWKEVALLAIEQLHEAGIDSEFSHNNFKLLIERAPTWDLSLLERPVPLCFVSEFENLGKTSKALYGKRLEDRLGKLDDIDGLSVEEGEVDSTNVAGKGHFQQNVSVHQIRPTQRAFTTSTTFPLPVNQLPTSAVGFGWHVLLDTISRLIS